MLLSIVALGGIAASSSGERVERSAGEAVVYVDRDATGPGHDGTSWCTAFRELHEALDGATAGTTIRVADGTYRPDSAALADPREATFTLISGVTIEGGYAGCGGKPTPDQREIGQFETVLSGDLAGNDPDIEAYRTCCNNNW